MLTVPSARLCAAGVFLLANTSVQAQEARTLDPIRVQAEDPAADSYVASDARSATGLDLSLRDTPQSVTVITRERLDDQDLDDLFDVLVNTTGVSVQPVDRGRSTLTVRGFEVNNFQFDGIPTSLYIDNNPSTALFERIEVVRGATGLLSGAGDPSATVNMVRKRADRREFSADLSAALGSWEHLGGTLDVATPLNGSGSVRGRFVIDYSEQDAFIDLEHSQTTALYGVIEADLTDRTLLRVGVTDQSDRKDGVMWAGLPYWFADGTRTRWSRSRSTATDWNQWDVDDRNYFASISHQFGNEWTLRANAAYTTNDDEERMLWMWNSPDADTGLGMEAYPYHYLGGFDQHHFDVIASGPFSAWGRQHEITVGVMQSKLDEVWSNRDAVEPVASFPLGNFFEWDGSFDEPELGERYDASRYITTETALYAATRLQATDALKLILGLRVENYEMDAGARVWVPNAFTVEHKGELTPYAGVVFDLNEQFSLYGSYTSIFKPQELQDRNGDYLDPVEGNSYEIGVKAELLDGRLYGAAAVFRIDQENVGVEDVGYFVPPNNTDPAYRPAQGVKADGYELELVGKLTQDWEMTFGWSQFSAKDADGVHVAIDDPRKQLKLFTKYQFGGAAQGLTIGGGVNWNADQPTNGINPGTGASEHIGQDDWAIVDAYAKYQFNEQFSAQINAENLLDEKYVSRNTGWWGGPYIWGTPRSVNLSVSYQFR